MKIRFQRIEIDLCPSGALFLIRDEVLVLADLHLGKLIALKDRGVPALSLAEYPTIKKLEMDIAEKKPKHLILLGDIFHEPSKRMQRLADGFYNFLSSFKIDVTVTLGNHDRHVIHHSKERNVRFIKEYMCHSICFCHEPLYDRACIAGHIHPGVIVKKGRLSQRVKAFLVKDKTLILPAYGHFTGITPIKIPYDKAFILKQDNVTEYTR